MKEETNVETEHNINATQAEDDKSLVEIKMKGRLRKSVYIGVSIFVSVLIAATLAIVFGVVLGPKSTTTTAIPMPTTTPTTVGQQTTQNFTTTTAKTTITVATTTKTTTTETTTVDKKTTQELTTKVATTTEAIAKVTTKATTKATTKMTTKVTTKPSVPLSTTASTIGETSTTTTLSNKPKKTNVLVVSTNMDADREYNSLPIILNRNGLVIPPTNFTENFWNSTLFYDTTGVLNSCGVTWRDQHFVFGGNGSKGNLADPQQIAQVVDPGCSLKRIGKLTQFLFVQGACTVMDDKIYLCFNHPDKQANKIECQKCFFSETGPLGPWTATRDSNKLHCRTHIANSGSDIIAIGNGNVESDYHNHVELFVAAEKRWIDIGDFPISDSKYNAIFEAPIVFHDDAYYVFGGRWEKRTKRGDRPVFATTSNEIIRLGHVTHKWSKAGTMKTARYLHRVIHDGTVFLVVGGGYSKDTEQCKLNVNGSLSCEKQEPTLFNFAQFPELFLVDDEFCTEEPNGTTSGDDMFLL